MNLNNKKIIVAIENAVIEQVEASGFTGELHRLDGEKIVDVILQQIEGFVLIDNSELESLKSDNEHFTKSCIDWTERAYKQRAKVELVKNEVERFKQSGTHLDLSRFLDNLIEFSTFKHNEEFEGFVLVPKELSDEWMAAYVDAQVIQYCKDYEDLPFSVEESELPEIRESYRLPIRNAHKRLMLVIQTQEQGHDGF